MNKLRSGKVLIKVHEPISTVGKTRADIDELLNESRQVISNGIDRLDKRLKNAPARKRGGVFT